jgi:hypothetical protein
MRSADPSHITLAVILCGWLALSVVRQFHEEAPNWIRRLDVLKMVPDWRFFGPHPQYADHHLFVRDILDTGESTDWKRVALASTKGYWVFIWNPNRRLDKWLPGHAAVLEKSVKFTNRRADQSGSYQSILNYVTGLPHCSGSRALQFAISTSLALPAPNDSRILFCSDIHPLEGYLEQISR